MVQSSNGVVNKNLQPELGPPTTQNTKPPLSVPTGLADTGCTGHFLSLETKEQNFLQNIKMNPSPIHVEEPSGNIISSTHTATVPWHQAPASACQGHLFPALQGKCLVSIAQFCNAGCTAMFTPTQVLILHNGNVIIKGTRCPTTGLWKVPLATEAPCNPSDPPEEHCECHGILNHREAPRGCGSRYELIGSTMIPPGFQLTFFQTTNSTPKPVKLLPFMHSNITCSLPKDGRVTRNTSPHPIQTNQLSLSNNRTSLKNVFTYNKPTKPSIQTLASQQSTPLSSKAVMENTGKKVVVKKLADWLKDIHHQYLKVQTPYTSFALIKYQLEERQHTSDWWLLIDP